MARHRRRETTRIEAPEWYRVFHPEAWDEPDAHEQSMIDGSSGFRCWPWSPDWRPDQYPGWPQHLHDEHARRRWRQARGAYCREHPDFGTQEFNDILARRAVRRETPESRN